MSLSQLYTVYILIRSENWNDIVCQNAALKKLRISALGLTKQNVWAKYTRNLQNPVRIKNGEDRQ
jgi:hypothetical protein